MPLDAVPEVGRAAEAVHADVVDERADTHQPGVDRRGPELLGDRGDDPAVGVDQRELGLRRRVVAVQRLDLVVGRELVHSGRSAPPGRGST
ncbi:hypothetical protein GCM10009539_63770 [Cryptosporangium japonicum]|uniref:Uncharacterized protein n=1 Tax=Cryptosporangium japonicum TaxID=80872 RepID=A0ABP3EL01_9ACTN